MSSAALEAKGYQVYLPTYTRQRRPASQQHRPLFPGYLFCRFASSPTGKIVTSPGVIGVVGFGGCPAPVSEAEIDSVRLVLQSGIAAQAWRCIPIGTPVRVRSGPLEGAHGILVSSNDSRRLIVSIEILRRSIATELPEDTELDPLPRMARAAADSSLWFT